MSLSIPGQMFDEYMLLLKSKMYFNNFLKWFVNDGNKTEVDGKIWDDWNLNKSSTDTNVVQGKINYLTALIERYAEEIRKVA